MFEITIKGDTLEELAGNVNRMAALYQNKASYDADDAAREEMQAQRKAASRKKAAPPPEDPEDKELEPARPMPETAKQVVDAGTGKPVSADDQPIRMTMDDVKTAAAKLAAKDVEQLKLTLSKYGAGKLTEVPAEKLGDFASDVMEALEE